MKIPQKLVVRNKKIHQKLLKIKKIHHKLIIFIIIIIKDDLGSIDHVEIKVAIHLVIFHVFCKVRQLQLQQVNAAQHTVLTIKQTIFQNASLVSAIGALVSEHTSYMHGNTTPS